MVLELRSMLDDRSVETQWTHRFQAYFLVIVKYISDRYDSYFLWGNKNMYIRIVFTYYLCLFGSLSMQYLLYRSKKIILRLKTVKTVDRTIRTASKVTYDSFYYVLSVFVKLSPCWEK